MSKYGSIIATIIQKAFDQQNVIRLTSAVPAFQLLSIRLETRASGLPGGVLLRGEIWALVHRRAWDRVRLQVLELRIQYWLLHDRVLVEIGRQVFV